MTQINCWSETRETSWNMNDISTCKADGAHFVGPSFMVPHPKGYRGINDDIEGNGEDYEEINADRTYDRTIKIAGVMGAKKSLKREEIW